jgi:hypothetical protein
MNIFGDLERFFVDTIWPIRVPLAIALVVGMVAFVYVAWRRGWLAAARAHPKPVVIGLVLVLVIAGPLGWILGSPLFTRSELLEEVPATAVVATETTSTTDIATSDALLATTLAAGEWAGADDFHFGSGGARLIEGADGSLTLALEDFSVQNGPDLFVYVSSDPNGWNEAAINLGGLKATDGTFSYQIPEGISADDIASAVVWCKAFGVLFASAPLTPAAA